MAESGKVEPSEQRAYERADPQAASLVESLRAFGYSPQAALADLVDNSITAGAQNVWMTFAWAGSRSFATILDDGSGMTEEVLREAMRPGTIGPLAHRGPQDLGRFGLGLKTASFSQARRLTVSSKTSGVSPAIRCWDLDYVNATGEWRLLVGAAAETSEKLTPLDSVSTGTLVVWEKMDRWVAGTNTEDERAHRRFLSAIDAIECHLAMVFHRFLERAGRRLHIWINGREVAAWDPYMRDHPATDAMSPERLFLGGDEMLVSPYVLPHRSRLTDEQSKRGAGPQGWNAQQGFYIYRNQRLLVPGSWLNLGFAKEEHHKLARISVEIPNSLDLDWDINVTKSRASPPGVLREDLLRIARATRERAVAVYRYRGQIVARGTSEPWVFAWMRLEERGGIRYRINRDHPIVVRLMDGLGNDKRRELNTVFRLLEETVPVPTIAIDSVERPDMQRPAFEDASQRDLIEFIRSVYDAVRQTGVSHAAAIQRLASMEPFGRFPELIGMLDGDEGAAAN